MLKILFLIHDLGQGGAEKVLVSLVNNMDQSKFDISVTALFGGGVNEQFLAPHIHFRSIFPKNIPGNSKLMKLLTPRQLHRLCVKEHYDIEVSYLEGPSARVVSGCSDSNTKLISWIHSEQHSTKNAAGAFRNEQEMRKCYNRFHQTICVSQQIRDNFCQILAFQKPCQVLYNTVESQKILEYAQKPAPELVVDGNFRLIAVGTLKKSKGYMRLLRIVKRLLDEQHQIHLYILGIGPLSKEIKSFISGNHLDNAVTLLGYQANPYKYVRKCDLFISASFSEGFSTAATEALIVGTPVITTNVPGMSEMLGDNKYGIITENDEESLYIGIRDLLITPGKLAHYQSMARERGSFFSTEKTVQATEEMLMKVWKEKL